MVKKITLIPGFLIVLLVTGGFGMSVLGMGNRKYTYKRDDSYILNPYIGYAPDAGNVSLCENSSLVYLNLLWSELEPEEGEYNWNYIEDIYHLERWRSEGKNLVLRFVCDMPTRQEHMDIPQWLYDKTGDGEFYEIEYGRGYCPDYNNEEFIKAHHRAIAEIGRHFSEDSFLSYVELGSLGHWGEWHTYYQAGLPRIPETKVREDYVRAYEESFSYAKLLMRRPFIEMPDGFGVFNDMLGAIQDTFVWMRWIQYGGDYESTGEKGAIKAVPEIWNTAPVGGEFTSSIPISVMLDTDFDQTVKMIEDAHMSFIGPKIPDYKKNPGLLEASKKAHSHIGYRFRVESLEFSTPFLGKETRVTAGFINDGVAPIYFDHKACIYVKLPEGADPEAYSEYCDSYGKEGSECERMLRFETDIDLTELTSGKRASFSLILPKAVLEKSGTKIYAGIEDPKTGNLCISLAMKEDREGLLTLLFER